MQKKKNSRGDVKRRIEVIVTMHKKSMGGTGGGGPSGCEQRIEVIVKMQIKKEKSRVGSEGWGKGGCDRRTEVIVKMQKYNCENAKIKSRWGRGSGWMLNEELKLL